MNKDIRIETIIIDNHNKERLSIDNQENILEVEEFFLNEDKEWVNVGGSIMTYDENNNKTSTRESGGYWWETKYDEYSRKTHHRDCNGYFNEKEYNHHGDIVFYAQGYHAEKSFTIKTKYDEQHRKIRVDDSRKEKGIEHLEYIKDAILSNKDNRVAFSEAIINKDIEVDLEDYELEIKDYKVFIKDKMIIPLSLIKTNTEKGLKLINIEFDKSGCETTHTKYIPRKEMSKDKRKMVKP